MMKVAMTAAIVLGLMFAARMWHIWTRGGR